MDTENKWVIVKQIIISSVGIFLDMIGTSLRGRILAEGFCEFEGFFYMFIGQYMA